MTALAARIRLLEDAATLAMWRGNEHAARRFMAVVERLEALSARINPTTTPEG